MTRPALLLFLTLSLSAATPPPPPQPASDVATAAAQAQKAAADARQAAETLEKWRQQQSNFSILWPTIPAFLALLVSYLNGRRQKVARSENNAKLGEIHVLVNGRLSAALKEVEDLTAEVQKLREMHSETTSQAG